MTATTAWMSVQKAAIYAGHSTRHLYLALREYVQTDGKRGLAGVQPAPGCTWRLRTVDVDTWLAGKPPRRNAKTQ
jgi:hypothetical protein